MLNAQQIADKWASNTQNAGEAYKNGIAAVTESPTQKAAQAVDRYMAGVTRAVNSGKYQDGLLRVTLQDWKNAALNKGANRLGTGVQQAKPKMVAFLGEFLPHLESLKQMLQSQPRGDIEQNINRMIAAARFNATFRRRS